MGQVGAGSRNVATIPCLLWQLLHEPVASLTRAAVALLLICTLFTRMETHGDTWRRSHPPLGVSMEELVTALYFLTRRPPPSNTATRCSLQWALLLHTSAQHTHACTRITCGH